MHTLGKVFLWINLLMLVPAAVLLSAKLLNVRNYWMQQVEDGETKIAANEKTIAEKEKQLDQLEADLAHQRQAWDTLWSPVPGRADAQGVVTVGVGPDQGFGVVPEGAPAPIVHVFVPDPAAPQDPQRSLYVGPFQIAAARAGQSQLQPMFRVVGNPPVDWPEGGWRIWQVVPSQAPSRVVELTNEIVEKREAVASREATLALQQKAVEQAQAHLESRRLELFGNPQAPKIEEAPEVTQGLVAALREAEAARNAQLAELDRLRREVAEAYDRLTQLVAENGRLAERLGTGPELSSAR
ncbi:MAG TPA: hypothetical protein VF170_20215 [Planctomycetaceae bacterium]